MKLRIAFATLSLLLIATFAWLSVRLSQQRDRIALLESKLSAHPGAVAATLPANQDQRPAGTAPAPRESRVPGQPATDAPACPDTESVNSRLHETATSLTRAQTRITDLEAQMEELNKDRSRAATHETQMQAQIADLNQTIEAMHSERPQLTKRIRDAEAEADRLRQQAQSVNQKNAQFGQLTGDFKEMARRQQVYTTSILRRYRELTDLFRSLPGMVEVRGNGPELARIQSAISGADEDLRQLSDLNARMGRLQTQITTAVASR